MNIIKINSQEEADKLADADGNIIIEGHIEIGNFYLRVKGHLRASGCIEAGWGIEAGEGIEAGGGIVGQYVFSFFFDVRAKTIKTTKLPFWRQYYADMPPMKKYREAILDERNCWDTLKAMITPAEAQKICKWNGWHWIVRAQLEMFLCLKTIHTIDARAQARTRAMSATFSEQPITAKAS